MFSCLKNGWNAGSDLEIMIPNRPVSKFLLAVVLLAVLPAQAQAPRVASTVPASRVLESLLPQQISGKPNLKGLIFGITNVSSEAAIFGASWQNPREPVAFPSTENKRNPSFRVYGASDRLGGVCVEINKAQAGYKAEFKSAVPVGQGPVTISYESSRAARKALADSKLHSSELAIKAREMVGGKCQTTAALLPTSWSSAASDTLTIFAGGRSMGTAKAKLVGEKDERPCDEIGALIGNRGMGDGNYYYACRLAVAATPCNQDLTVQVSWYKGARAEGVSRFKVRNGCR